MQQAKPGVPRVEMVNITKTYGSIRSLRGVNLKLEPGEVLGLVGDNGAGKSTLTKVLSGAVVPTSGAIRVDGEEMHFTNPADAREMLKGLGISIPHSHLLVRNLSGGQRQAIAIARAAAFDPKVLIIDEH